MGDYGGNLNIFAHSMGNVVVSEALRQGGKAKNYVACQAASVARAYDAINPDRLTDARIDEGLSERSSTVSALAKGWAAEDNHPDVFASFPSTGEVYYKGVKGNVPRIINHHNRLDDALAWWLAGQAKKPNGNYRYRESSHDHPDPAWQKGYVGMHNAFIVESELTFPEDAFEIFARAAQPDSEPLGSSVTVGVTTAGEITGSTNLNTSVFDFQDGEEDHSAQFRSTVQRRWDYWKQLLQDFDLPVNE